MATLTRTSELRITTRNDTHLAYLDVLQGSWTEDQYLKLTDYNRAQFEFVDGALEELPMPTDFHQRISLWLVSMLRAYIEQRGGVVRYSPLRMRVRAGAFREPDLLLLLDKHDARRQNRFWLGADLVIEIISDDDPERDTVVKRAEYAAAGILEYWIVNPDSHTLTVLTLADDIYHEHAVFTSHDTLTSPLLHELAAPLTDVFLRD